MYVLDEENNKIEFDVNIGSLPLTAGQKIMASSQVIEHLLRFATYLSEEKNRKEFVAFKKFGYIVELFEKVEEDAEPVELTEDENAIISMFEKMELKEIISLLNILVDIKFPILDRFLLNYMDYILKSMPAEELKIYFESCRIESDVELPDYII